jgi:hypothetical protein
LQVIGADNILPAGDHVLASLKQVYAVAQDWLNKTVPPDKGA